jgi:hypothetical protein
VGGAVSLAACGPDPKEAGPAGKKRGVTSRRLTHEGLMKLVGHAFAAIA